MSPMLLVLLGTMLKLSCPLLLEAGLVTEVENEEEFESHELTSEEIINTTDSAIILYNVPTFRTVSPNEGNKNLADARPKDGGKASQNMTKNTSNIDETVLEAHATDTATTQSYRNMSGTEPSVYHESSLRVNSSCSQAPCVTPLPTNLPEMTSEVVDGSSITAGSLSGTNDTSSNETFTEVVSGVPTRKISVDLTQPTITVESPSSSISSAHSPVSSKEIGGAKRPQVHSGKDQEATTSNPMLFPRSSPPASDQLQQKSSPAAERQDVPEDFVLIEMIRLVFQGDVATAGFPNKAYGLLESFLTRAARELKTKDGSDWSFKLSSTLQAYKFGNTTYMDFRVTHTAKEEISVMFQRLQLSHFISQNSDLHLLAECWSSRNCQNASTPEAPPLSVWEKNARLLTTVVALSSAGLAVIVAGVLCSRVSRAGTLKADVDADKKDSPEARQTSMSVLRPANQTQVVTRSENVDDIDVTGTAKDEDEAEAGLRSTWVISLDETAGEGRAVVVVTTQDTKL